MRITATHLLAAALCAALALALAPAYGEEEEAPPRYRVIEADTHIPPTRSVNGYEFVDDDTLLIKTGANRWYAAELRGDCGRHARWDWSIGIDSRGGGRIDRFSEVIVDGRRCGIESVALVERLPEAPDTAPEAESESAP